MYLTLDENQRMARAAEAETMPSRRQSPPTERKRASLNGVFSGTASRQTAPSRPNPRYLANVVYWPNPIVREEEDPSSLDANSITHLIYTAATVDHDGTVRLCDESPNFGPDQTCQRSSLEACVALKDRNPKLKVLVSVGGPASGSHCLNYVAGNDRLSRAFGKAVRDFAAKYGLDGIEHHKLDAQMALTYWPVANWHVLVDWSSASNAEEAERFLKLTATTEGYLGPDLAGRWFILSMSLPGTGPLLQCANLREAHKLVDLINVQAFDFPGMPKDRSALHAQLSGTDYLSHPMSNPSCLTTINLFENRGINMRKVVLGIPCSGRAFLGASGPLQTFEKSREVAYKRLPIPGTREYIDEPRGAAYCSGEVQETESDERTPIFVSYDNLRTVQLKAQLVKSRGLGGLGFWNGTGDRQGPESLIIWGFKCLQDESTNGV